MKLLYVLALFFCCHSPNYAFAQQAPDTTVAANEMVTAATRFLSMLEPEQRAKANLELDDAGRENWEFVPDPFCKEPRKGLSIKDMTAYQRALAESIPTTALSHRGNLAARTVMALEHLVFLQDGKEFRESDNYRVTIYGKPTKGGTWGWRFEGHHLSIHVTIVDGKSFSVTPSFFGTNPAKVVSGPMAGTEVLDLEQTLALELINSMSDEQLKLAMIPGKPEIANDKGALEIATLNHSIADRAKVAFGGVKVGDLNQEQSGKLKQLTNLYAQMFRPQVLAGTKSGADIGGDPSLSFAWFGGKKQGERHYYRILSDKFVIEFANSQNKANHVHAAWRDFDGDFGRNILGEHLKSHSDQ